MFEASEKWRKDFKVDDLYNNFEYPEKEEVDKWYPQYYHKTDNVSAIRSLLEVACFSSLSASST
jgi:hypothetical protein